MNTIETYNLKQQFAEKFHLLELNLNGEANSTLHNLRKDALLRFNKLGFPAATHEDWKYTSLKDLQQQEYEIIPFNDDENIDVTELLPEDFDGDLLIFVNGNYSVLNSKIINKTSVFPISQIEPNSPQLANLDSITNSKTDGFSALNTAFLKDGFLVELSEEQDLEEPIYAVFFNDTEQGNVFNHNRILVNAADGAKAKIIAIYVSFSDENTSASTNVAEIFAGENAQIELYNFQLEANNHSHINSIFTKQEKNSLLTCNTFTLGGKLVRNGLQMMLNGEFANAYLNGLYLSNENQLMDNHTRVDHLVPNCHSNQVYKGVMGDESKAVFNGQIHVYPDAQKTNAFQSNRNVVLTDTAAIYTKPQLEIFADDVQCSHGCTTGQLNQDAVFYMQARGIPKEEAQRVLLQGFAGEVIERIGLSYLKPFVTDLVADKLDQMNS